jgi:tetratricopeptide (TPR) repeat protein
VVTIAYLVYNFQAIRRGEPISPIKLLLMVTTIAFLWVVWVYIDDIFLGLAVWEIFHDLQYFAIVWVYNRGLVDKGRIKGGFMQFLFRPRVAMIAIYGLLIFAYGMVGNASRYVAGNWMLLSSSAVATFNTVMVALVLTSTFLHYYYDGFIWKMRQADTREGLDIQGEGATSAGDFWDRIRTAWYARRAGVMQAAYVVLPIAALGLMEWNRQRDAIVTHQHVVMAVPAAMPAYQGLADAYYQEGHVDAAIETYREAVKRHPERDFEAWRRLGEALVTRYGFAKSDEAEGYFRNSLDIWPKQYEAWRNLGQLEQYTFSMTQDLARAEKSVDYLETAFRNGGKKDAKVLNLLGSGYSYLGKYEDAVAIFEQCLARHPNYLDALFNLGQTHLQRGDINTGWKLIEQAVQRDAKYEPAVRQLRKSLRASRPLSPANAQT